MPAIAKVKITPTVPTLTTPTNSIVLEIGVASDTSRFYSVPTKMSMLTTDRDLAAKYIKARAIQHDVSIEATIQ